MMKMEPLLLCCWGNSPLDIGLICEEQRKKKGFGLDFDNN